MTNYEEIMLWQWLISSEKKGENPFKVKHFWKSVVVKSYSPNCFRHTFMFFTSKRTHFAKKTLAKKAKLKILLIFCFALLCAMDFIFEMSLFQLISVIS